MDPSRGDSRYNLNYSMSSIGLSLSDQVDMYGGNPVTALGGRPPSGGLIQTMGSSSGVGLGARPGSLMPNTTQCQSMGNSTPNNAGAGGGGGGGGNGQQQRGIKRASSDCYEDHHRGGSAGLSAQSLQGLDSCSAGGNGQHAGQQQPGGTTVPDVVDDSYNSLQNKKSPPANGKKTKGRVKIKMEYIDNKLRRYTTFSKRKTGIMKKAYELSTLTGTQVMLLVASETGHVYTFATRKLQPMITSEAGKQLIQTCLNSPDPPSVGGGDQRMSATGFEETELSYNIADEDSKEGRSPLSSANESDESSDVDSPAQPKNPTETSTHLENNSAGPLFDNNTPTSCKGISAATVVSCNERLRYDTHHGLPTSTTSMDAKLPTYRAHLSAKEKQQLGAGTSANSENFLYSPSTLANMPQEVLLQLIHSGHLQLHTDKDGSSQYVTIPITSSAVNLVKTPTKNVKSSAPESRTSPRRTDKGRSGNNAATSAAVTATTTTTSEQSVKSTVPSTNISNVLIKEEFE